MRIVIVGGVAGGASAAARARRLDETAEIILLQSGPDVSFGKFCVLFCFCFGDWSGVSFVSCCLLLQNIT